MVSTWVKTGGMIVAFGVSSEILYQVYKWFRSRQRIEENETESRTDIHEVLFFPDKMIACVDHFVGDYGCSNLKCRFTHERNSLSRLYEHLVSAKMSLDVCVFVICCAELGDLIIKCHRKGVKVRIICDDEQMDVNGSQIWKLRKEGINVRTDNSSYLMHHKFVLVDNQLLITGSFNWTRQAISGNQENLLILNHRETVALYGQEFEQLWTNFNPRNHSSSELYRPDEITS